MAVLVSVLIPVYNAGQYVLETVHSVLEQSLQEFEVILVDDGSTDGCLGPVEQLRDRRIRILRQTNQGAPSTMNRALEAASGEFVAFLDHDDLWDRHKLEAQLQHFAAHPEADVTFCWSRWIDERGRDLELEPRRWQGPISFDELVRDFVIGNTSSIMARRAVVQQVGGFDLSLPRAYDQDLVLRIARLRPGNVQATPEVLTSYRRHPGQMSRHWQDAVPEWYRLRERIHSAVSRETLAVGDSNMQRYFAWLAYEEQEYVQACRFLAGTFRAYTWRALGDRRNWLLGGASVAGWLLPRPVHRALEAGGKRLLTLRRPALGPWLPWLVPVSLLLLWQLATEAKLVNPLLVPSPIDLLRAAARLFASGELTSHLWATLRRVGLGLALGGSAGILAGTWLGSSTFARKLLEPLLVAGSSIPKVTLLPLVMLLLGVNERARMAPVTASCFVILAFHALDGARNMDQNLVQLAQHYGARPLDLFRYVYLPSSLPAIFTGLRVAAGTALVVTISTELIGAQEGLGHLIWSAYQTFSVDKLYLGIALAAILGFTLQTALAWIRRWVVPWKTHR